MISRRGMRSRVSLRRCVSLEEPGPERENAGGDSADGKHDQDELNEQYSHSVSGEETSDAEVGYKQRPPRHEVSSLRERCEEGDAKSAIGERIEEAMRSGYGKEEGYQCPPGAAKKWRVAPESHAHKHNREDKSEDDGVRHAPMTPEIRILDAIGVKADVEIKSSGTANCQEPESQWHRTTKAGFPRSNRDKGVCQGSRHLTAPQQAAESVAR